MKNSSSFNNLFSHDRKILYIVLSIVMISVLTLTVVYATLSTALNITGNTEVTAASWDIHFDNIQVDSGSVKTSSPTIIDSKTLNFNTSLSKPGDYYKFTVDIVNDGNIDAMIDSVIKTPELTEEQAKYIKYEIEYSTGASISTKQLLSKNSTKTLKVTVAYRNDLTASDLPTSVTTIDLSFTMIYMQADETYEIELGAAPSPVKIVSGDFNTVGSEVCIDTECFYVISSDADSVTMLAKYNLYVGGVHDGTTWTPYGDEATGLQNLTMIGYGNNIPYAGTMEFSRTNYWNESIITYPTYVYNLNSSVYNVIENYKNKLEEKINIIEARLITIEELVQLGCSTETNNCKSSKYNWVYSTTYWTGTASSNYNLWGVISSGGFDRDICNSNFGRGVRPVIIMSK